ncbi:AraC family transcriptional regulator [Chryseobacterium sp.]|uniref:helix-turn-helix domain-containing protein n=1 Tax=Chryseobacterium sp. TaxID=1871047 RepID=UPI0025C510B0|nr:AraC family transcriptional regulator [Chryseobacterium sp.]
MDILRKNNSKILETCYFTRSREGEQFIHEHVFSFQMAGTLTLSDGKKTYLSKEGDFRLCRKNRLAKFEKKPPENGEFKIISIYLDQEMLQKLSKELNLKAEKTTGIPDTLITIDPHPLYQSFVDSLFVYLQLSEEEQSVLMETKVREAVQIMLKLNPELKNVLFDFSDPGKIDIESFMLKNFRFNVQLNRFAYLTGRSLSTFKRDFEKVFHTTPSRWLTQHRLKEAYYLIKEKGEKPSDVYVEVGFEDLSHFSHAFRKQFGVSPSMLR